MTRLLPLAILAVLLVATPVAAQQTAVTMNRPVVQTMQYLLYLPDDYDSSAFYLNPEMRPAIDRGSADQKTSK